MTRIQRQIVNATMRLAYTYPKTDLNNPPDPLDDLIYIILSGQTGESGYQSAFAKLRARFPDWDDARRAPERAIERPIRGAGLSVQKARYIKALLNRLRTDFGHVSLDALANWPTAEAEAYLCSLPGTGIKTARCVLLYTLDREVFPADVNCLRIMDRMGWLRWDGARMEKLADRAQALVLPALRRELHICLVQHGRAVCKSGRPDCGACCVREFCRMGMKR